MSENSRTKRARLINTRMCRSLFTDAVYRTKYSTVTAYNNYIVLRYSKAQLKIFR